MGAGYLQVGIEFFVPVRQSQSPRFGYRSARFRFRAVNGSPPCVGAVIPHSYAAVAEDSSDLAFRSGS